MSGDCWGGRCTLIAEEQQTDSMRRAQLVLTDVRTVFCNDYGVRQNEFYQADAQGYRVELQLEIRRSCFDASKITHVRYKGCRYRILRAYPAKCAENVVLVCIDKLNEARKS